MIIRRFLMSTVYVLVVGVTVGVYAAYLFRVLRACDPQSPEAAVRISYDTITASAQSVTAAVYDGRITPAQALGVQMLLERANAATQQVEVALERGDTAGAMRGMAIVSQFVLRIERQAVELGAFPPRVGKGEQQEFQGVIE